MGYTDTSIGMPSSSANIGVYDAQGTLNPWTKMSRTVYPKTVESMFAWSSELWLHNGTYSEGISKSVRYFLTDIEIRSAGEDDLDYKKKESYKKKLFKDFDLLRDAEQLASEAISHGNSFSSIYFPFQRNMICDQCGFNTRIEALMEETDPKRVISWKPKGGFVGKCPACDKQTTWEVKDTKRTTEDRKANVIRWPLKHIAIKENYLSGRVWITVNIPEWEHLSRPILTGDMDIIAETPMNILNAVGAKKKLELHEDEFYHMKCETITDVQVELNGFGVPLFMSDFEMAFMMTVLYKYLEAMSVDMVSPWRVLSPDQKANQNQDPLANINMGSFMSEVRGMIGAHRQNPTLISTLPYPLQQMLVGGDVSQLIPVEWYEHLGKQLLSNMGVPHEFQQSALQGNAAPMIGYKIFERNWQFLVDMLNGWTTWVCRKEGEQQKWEDVTATVVPMSVHNDPETRMTMVNLAAGGQVSWTEALKGYGKDYKEERMKTMDEAIWETEMQKKIEEKIENGEINTQFLRTPGPAENLMMMENMAAGINQQMMGGMPAPGGAPAPGGGGPPMPPMQPGGGAMGPQTGTKTVDGMMAEAQQMAAALQTSDHTTRTRQLSQLKSTDPALYSMVSMMLEDLEQEAAQQGKEMARQPQPGM